MLKRKGPFVKLHFAYQQHPVLLSTISFMILLAIPFIKAAVLQKSVPAVFHYHYLGIVSFAALATFLVFLPFITKQIIKENGLSYGIFIIIGSAIALFLALNMLVNVIPGEIWDIQNVKI